MIKHLFTIWLTTINFWCKAQDKDSIQKINPNYGYDTSRIIDKSDKLALYFNISGKMSEIDIKTNSSEKQLQLVPNGRTLIGLGIDYKWFGVGVSFSIPSTNKDEEIYGKTDRLDMQINYYQNSFGVDAYLKYYKGFYLQNPGDFTNWPSQNYPLLQNMETFAEGLAVYYLFNHRNFSYKAVFPRTMWQKKSSGSLILGAYINRNNCIAPEGVLPPELPDSLSSKYDIKGFSNTMIGISFGYTYTWVIKKRFFTNLSVVPGLGYAKPEITTSIENKKFEPAVSASFTIRLSLGYEAKHFYYGFNFIDFIDNFNYENIQVSSSTGNVRLFIGRRFDVSKIFKHNKN